MEIVPNQMRICFYSDSEFQFLLPVVLFFASCGLYLLLINLLVYCFDILLNSICGQTTQPA